MDRKVLFMLIVIAAVLSGTHSFSITGSEDAQASTRQGPSVYVYPVRINSDIELEDFISEMGLSGEGTPEEPYLIYGYYFQGELGQGDSWGYCLFIGNTTKHLRLDECWMSDASSNNNEYYRNSGLYLHNVRNLSVNNTSSEFNDGYGLYMFGCSNIAITNCSFTINGIMDGWMVDSEKVTIRDTEFLYGDMVGLEIQGSSDVDLFNVTSKYHSDDGIELNHGSSSITMERLNISGNYVGITIRDSHDNDLIDSHIHRNALEGPGYGVILNGAKMNTISGNRIEWSSVNGLTLYNSSGNVITSNYIGESWEMDLKVLLGGVNNPCQNTITGNTGSGDRPIGFYNRQVTLSGGEYSELILCRAHNSELTDVVVNGSADQNNGLFVFGSDDVTITNSVSDDNYVGISCERSHNTKVVGSHMRGNRVQGFRHVDGSRPQVMDCTIVDNSIGCDIGSPFSWIGDCSIMNNSATGIRAQAEGDASRGVMIDNLIGGSAQGIVLQGRPADGFHIYRNDIVNCFDSMVVSYSRDHRIEENSINGITNGSGILVTDTGDQDSGLLITNNEIQNKGTGITLTTVDGAELTHNTITSSMKLGLFITARSDYNLIHNNSFIENNGAISTYLPEHVQASDSGSGNRWATEGIPHGYGNHWGDWTGPDINGDEIVDDPYALFGSSLSEDPYPLTGATGKVFYKPFSPQPFKGVPGPGEVLLNWEASYYDGGRPLLGYRLYRGDSHLDATLLVELQDDQLSYLDQSGEPGRIYAYYLTSYNSEGESEPTFPIYVASYQPLEWPSVEITSPADGAYLNSSSFTVEWTGSGAGVPILGYEGKINSGDWFDLGLGTSFTQPHISDGVHNFTVRIHTIRGYNLSRTVHFTVDTTLPNLNITHPQEGSISNRSYVDVNWTGDDGLSGVLGYRTRLDGGNWTEVSLNLSIRLMGLEDGPHIIEVICFDLSGNSLSARRNFTIDTVIPYLLDFGPTGVIINTSQPIRFVLNEDVLPEDILFSIEPKPPFNVSLEVSGDGYALVPSGNFTKGTTYNVIIWGHDTAGNPFGPYGWNFTIFRETPGPPPVIVGPVWLSGRVVTESNVSLSGVVVTLDDTNATFTDRGGFFSFLVEPGNHTLLIIMSGFYDYQLMVNVEGTANITIDDIVLRSIETGGGPQPEDEEEDFPFVPVAAGIVGGGVIVVGVYLLKKKKEVSDLDIEE